MKPMTQESYAAASLLVVTPGPARAEPGPRLHRAGGRASRWPGRSSPFSRAVLSAVLTLVTWPVRLLSRTLFGLRALAKSRVKRVVILGLDGMDHGLTETMLEEGKLPHLAALRDQGCFKPLGSTVPPISPVAWSSFQTGVNPGKHNIFDFLTPDLRTYQRQAQLGRDPPAAAHRSAWGSTRSPSARPTCACCARASRSGTS